MIGGGLVAAALGWAALGGVAEAQDPATASAEPSCLGPEGPAIPGEGAIVVAILDDSGVPTYDVVIDGDTVAEAVPASGGEAYVYRPFADGAYRVVVRPSGDGAGPVLLDTNVTVRCALEPPAPRPPAPTTTVEQPAAAPGVAREDIRLTG